MSKKLILPLVTLLAACAAQPPVTRVPRHSERVPSGVDDVDAPSDSNGNEAWSPEYANGPMRDYAYSHLSHVTLAFYEEPSTDTHPAAEGNIAGSFAGLRSDPDFSYFGFSTAAEAEDFLEKNGVAPKPYVSQLYDIQESGGCVTVNVIDHYWQEPSHFFGLRAGRRIYGEHLKNYLLRDGAIDGQPEEVKAPLVGGKFCPGDSFRANGHTLRIAKATATLGLNTSSGPGATYPTYPALILVDETGKAYLAETNAIRRLKNLNETGKTAAEAMSETHKCSKSTHGTSEDYAFTSAEANARAKAIMTAQCATIGRKLSEQDAIYADSKYDVCFETGWHQSKVIAHGHCD